MDSPRALAYFMEQVNDDKITQISMTGSADFVFIIGSAADGTMHTALFLADCLTDPKRLTKDARDHWIRRMRSLQYGTPDIARMLQISQSLAWTVAARDIYVKE